MDNFKALRESIIEDCYKNEPLAQAILISLVKKGTLQHHNVIKIFEQLVDNSIALKIKEQQDNEENIYNEIVSSPTDS